MQLCKFKYECSISCKSNFIIVCFSKVFSILLRNFGDSNYKPKHLKKSYIYESCVFLYICLYYSSDISYILCICTPLNFLQMNKHLQYSKFFCILTRGISLLVLLIYDRLHNGCTFDSRHRHAL